ncbi:hypothetical protein [uncultured Shewanella sp.]|uniref:hypothetical protein n=1 Tax=uncultured Shewanella sp. TaxID=173975 RepID=UPI0026141125|nr:hypothetical protein [uncultured Shewanella sp.]
MCKKRDLTVDFKKIYEKKSGYSFDAESERLRYCFVWFLNELSKSLHYANG